MIQAHHPETHFTSSKLVRDAVLGIADGLTVPFALAAGISGALNVTEVVIIAGLAEIAAGTISMGLGGYLAAKSDAEHYAKEHAREHKEVREMPETEVAEVKGIFKSYGLTETEAGTIAEGLKTRPQEWVDFMMRFELGLERPRADQAMLSALTIGGAYALGGFIPLGPYFFLPSTQKALIFSSILTLCALFLFGYIKGLYTGLRPLRSAVHMALIGGLAAATAFFIARLIV